AEGCRVARRRARVSLSSAPRRRAHPLVWGRDKEMKDGRTPAPKPTTGAAAAWPCDRLRLFGRGLDHRRRVFGLARPHHRNDLVDHRVIGIAAARDRPHGGSIEPAVLDEAVVDVDADDLAECDMPMRGLPIKVIEVDDLQELAFERTGRSL